MLKQEILDNLNLYHSNLVRLTDMQGVCVEGLLQEIRENVLVMDILGEIREFVLDTLSDMECVGCITDYHTYKGTCEIDGIYECKVNNRQLFEKVRYLEFNCKVAFHVELNKIIRAKDVKLIEAVHILNEEVLGQDRFLYTLSGGERVVGILLKTEEGYCLQDRCGGKYLLDTAKVADITRCPKINDFVIATVGAVTYQGLVSAVTERGFNLLQDNGLHTISFTELGELRFFGRMSMKASSTGNKKYGTIDRTYSCKMPHYLHDEEEEKYAYDPDTEWIFVAGVNERGLIAKDAMINKGPQVTEAATWEVGIMARYISTQNKGYIGESFVVGAKMNRGTIEFKKENALPKLEEVLKKWGAGSLNNVYVVKYAFAGEQDKEPALIELLEVYDGRYIARVEVNEGSVRAIPYFFAARKNYLGRRVEVQLKNGEAVKGIWESYGRIPGEEDAENSVIPDEKYDDTNGILLTAEAKKQFISYGEIKEVRAIGTLKEYSQTEKFGKVDDIFSLYFVDVAESDRAKLSENIRVSFVLRDMPEDKRTEARRYEPWTECKDIRIVEDETLDVYVIAHADNVYTVYDRKDYGIPGAEPYEIAATLINPFKELDKYDYPARFSVRESEDGREYVGIHSVGEAPVPKKMRGYLVAMDEESVTFVEEKDYEKRDAKHVYPLAYVESSTKEKLRLAEYDYLVNYEWSERGVVITSICVKPTGKIWWEIKARFGFISTYDAKKDVYYITPANGGRRENKETYQLIRCYGSNIRWEEGLDDVADKDKRSIKLNLNHYQVSYTLLKDKVNCAHHAKVVNVTQKTSYKRVERITERTSLVEKATQLGFPFEEGVEYRYGFVKICRPENDYLGILDDATPQAMIPALEVKLSLADIRYASGVMPLNTKKYLYVVRYRELEQAGDLVRYGIDVLFGFKKPNQIKKYDSMRVEEEQLVLESTHGILYSDEELVAPKHATEQVPDFVLGETILYREKEEKRFKVANVKENRPEGLWLSNNQLLDVNQGEVYRFGVLTSLGRDEGEESGEISVGYLNHALSFRLRDTMESKVYNRFAQDTKRRLYIYACKGGIVTTVGEVTRELLGDLYWHRADILPEAEKNDSERILRVKIKKGERVLPYYWGDNNNPDLNVFMKNRKAEDTVAYVQEIVCPDWEQGTSDTKLVHVIADINTDKDFIEQMNLPNYIKVLNAQGSAAEYVYQVLGLREFLPRDECMAYIFYSDFYPMYEIKSRAEAGETLEELFARPLREGENTLRQLVSHIMTLDDYSFQALRDKRLLQYNSALEQALLDYCGVVVGTEELGVYRRLELCREKYQETLRALQDAFGRLKWEDNKICEGIVGVFNTLTVLQDERKLLVAEEDIKRLQLLNSCCRDVLDEETVDFQSAYRKIKSWFESVTKPLRATIFMTQVLSDKGEDVVKEKAQIIFDDIALRIRRYHDESKSAPDIRCELNEKDITNTQEKTYIIVRNGAEGTERCIDAKEVRIKWEIPQLDLRGEKTFVTLKGGTYEYFTIDLQGRNETQLGKLTFRWKCHVEYDTYIKPETIEYAEAWQEETFELVEQEDRSGLKSPYWLAARGDSLSEDDIMNIERMEKKEAFFAGILNAGDVDKNELRPRAMVTIFGQKECGKTSFYAKNIAELKREFGDKVVVIYQTIAFDINLENFEFELKTRIMELFWKELQQDKYGALRAIMEEDGFVVPDTLRGEENWQSTFAKVFGRFQEEAYAEYRIVFAIDEFTGVCAKILEHDRENGTHSGNLLNFIREFTNLGIIQIYIGHAAMMALLNKVGKENEFKTSTDLDLTQLTTDEADRVICMASDDCLKGNAGYLSHDPYKTVLGKRAKELLKDLSGNCPSMLMKLCNYMYAYYVKKDGNYLYEEDVIKMLYSHAFKGVFGLKDKNFAMIKEEAGDTDETRKAIETYLKHVAVKAMESQERVWKYDDRLTREETGIENPKEIRNLLIDRKVLEKEEIVGEGCTRIVMGVYEKYVRKDMIKHE